MKSGFAAAAAIACVLGLVSTADVAEEGARVHGPVERLLGDLEISGPQAREELAPEAQGLLLGEELRVEEERRVEVARR